MRPRGPPAHGASGRRSPPWLLSSTRCHRCVRRWVWRPPPPPEACAAGETDRPRLSFRRRPAKADIFQRAWVPSTVCERGLREDRSSRTTDSASLSRRPHDSWLHEGAVYGHCKRLDGACLRRTRGPWECERLYRLSGTRLALTSQARRSDSDGGGLGRVVTRFPSADRSAPTASTIIPLAGRCAANFIFPWGASYALDLGSWPARRTVVRWGLPRVWASRI